MQKMKRELYDKIIQSDLSKREIRFLFFLAARCDVHGQVKGIYYSEVSEEIGCYVATFYELRNHLTKKGFIAWEKNTSADMDVTLIGNSFINAQGQEEYTNYMDINISIFHDKSFFRLKAGAIRTAMELTKRVAAQEGITATNSLCWNQEDAEKRRKLFYKHGNVQKNLASRVHVSVRMMKKYLVSLRNWISVYQSTEGSYDIVTILKSTLLHEEYQVKKKKKKLYAERLAYVHFIKTVCRRNKIEANEQHLSDTADLVRQYLTRAKESGKNIFLQMNKAILYTTVSKMLNSYNVHSMLRKLMME